MFVICSGCVRTVRLPEIAKSMQARSFFSRLEFDIALSPSSWNVIIIKATKIFTKKNGNTIKNTFFDLTYTNNLDEQSS